ncbi:nuclear transport factor 2 family protein [Kitasatospora sp. NPDC004614]|uniref:nuclear transport factor 2 family protein n=1 Tax=unclassified Kitasatospora TaxID=2633591 RepID=UPI0036CDAB5B
MSVLDEATTGTVPLTRQEAERIWNGWLRMWNEDPSHARTIIAPTYRLHLPTVGATIDPADITDPAAMENWVRGFAGKFGELTYRTDVGPVVDGDLLVVRWYGTAICKGLTGWPRDVAGRPIRWVGVDILRVADGVITEAWTQGAETTEGAGPAVQERSAA